MQRLWDRSLAVFPLTSSPDWWWQEISLADKCCCIVLTRIISKRRRGGVRRRRKRWGSGGGMRRSRRKEEKWGKQQHAWHHSLAGNRNLWVSVTWSPFHTVHSQPATKANAPHLLKDSGTHHFSLLLLPLPVYPSGRSERRPSEDSIKWTPSMQI